MPTINPKKHRAQAPPPKRRHRIEKNLNSGNVIRAELSGSETAAALGISITVYTPLLDLCRALVAAGHDPATPLHAYRGDVLCLRVRSIGEAAKLRASSRGVGFEPLPPPTVSGGSAIERTRRPVVRGQTIPSLVLPAPALPKRRATP